MVYHTDTKLEQPGQEQTHKPLLSSKSGTAERLDW